MLPWRIGFARSSNESRELSLTQIPVCRQKPASEVFVTGTFDNWSKSAKLEKVGDGFEKTVTLPDASEKIFYKVRGVRVLEISFPSSSTRFCTESLSEWSP